MAGILSRGWLVPEERRSAADVAALHGVSPGALRDFGLIETTVAGPDDHPSTLAARAVRRALDAAELSADDVDLLIFAGITRDRPAPWVAAFGVLHALGATRAAGFDLSARCPGLHDALWVAASLVDSGRFGTVVVATGDRFDALLPPSRPKTQLSEAVYSAGGAAAVVSARADNDIVAYAHHTNPDLSLHDQSCPSAGGTRAPLDATALAERRHEWQNHLRVDQGLALREFLVRAERHNLQSVCRDAGFDAVDFVAVSPLHVADQIASLAALGIAADKILPVLPTHGHMGPADSLVSIGLALQRGIPIGPRLVMSTRSITSANALAVRGRTADLGIRTT
jgi:3-oxoacyl-[acyl-carrier-protein] synthase-3